MGGVSGLGGGQLGVGDGLQERRGQGRRGERQEVQADEEGFVGGAADEQNELIKYCG